MNCFQISVYVGFNTKDNRKRFSAKENTRCSCLSFCKCDCWWETTSDGFPAQGYASAI